MTLTPQNVGTYEFSVKGESQAKIEKTIKFKVIVEEDSNELKPYVIEINDEP